MSKRRTVFISAIASLLMLLTWAGCAPTTGARYPLSPALGNLRSDEEYITRRADYDALALTAPGRAAQRGRLTGWLLLRVAQELEQQHTEKALDFFRVALTLWDADELWPPLHDPTNVKPAAVLSQPDAQNNLLQTARTLEKIFQRRGGHRAALLTLAVINTLNPRDAAAQERWRQLLAWTSLEDNLNQGENKTIEDLESAVEAWPAPCVVQELARRYLEQIVPQSRIGTPGLSDKLAEMLRVQPDMAIYKLIALYLRVSRPEDVLGMLHGIDQEKMNSSPLVEALQKSVQPGAQVREVILLAGAFMRSESMLPVAERICRDAAQRFPKEDAPWLCVGEFASQRGRLSVAQQAFEQALRIDPSTWPAWIALAKIYHSRLFQLASDDKLGNLTGELNRIEQLHAQAQARFPKRQLSPSVANALFEVGRGYYNAGHIAEALRYLRQSLNREPNPQAYDELAQIALKRGQGPDALAACDDALRVVEKQDSTPSKIYWQAKFERCRGDAWELLGQHDKAMAAWQGAVNGWTMLAQMDPRLGADERAEAELECGKTLYLMGNRQKAIASLERAIDAAPDRGVTYADVLSFLVPRGEREEALDAYHRALGRSEMSEYLKVYFTLWILNLDRRAGEAEDPLGQAFLASVNGTQWYHELARWASGRESDADLTAHADTTAKRSEAYFYQAMRAVERGQNAEAQVLWRSVIATEMMSYFEYDMATYYLRHGASKPLSLPPASLTPETSI